MADGEWSGLVSLLGRRRDLTHIPANLSMCKNLNVAFLPVRAEYAPACTPQELVLEHAVSVPVHLNADGTLAGAYDTSTPRRARTLAPRSRSRSRSR